MTGSGVASEFGTLTAVLLHRPGPAIANYPDPVAIQHLAPINYEGLMREYDAIIATFSGLGVAVHLVDGTPLSDDPWYRYNLMYCRDLLFMTPGGAILGRMANDTRREEPRYAARALAAAGIPVLAEIGGEGTFEGADALWLRPDLVLVGVGHRTNQEGYTQVAQVLTAQGVACLAVPSYQTRTQHLLGTVQIVDRDLALVREEITDAAVSRVLTSQGVQVVTIPEHPEVVTRQAMNIVTVAPRTILMTAGCPATRARYAQAGLTIAAELELNQLLMGAGGLACASGILARRQ